MGDEIYIYRCRGIDTKFWGFHIEQGGDQSHVSDIEYAARYIASLNGPRLYNGDRQALVTYLDGYFGRPLVPGNVFRLTHVRGKEKRKLERLIEKELKKLKQTPAEKGVLEGV
ncbi:hypothetical protein KY311_00715 [Candidatus Woesearchaeota archaeon]|nr:hypothetical protein [Candidatus Woesearchaeota archaeon]